MSDLRSTLKKLDVQGDVIEAFRLIAQAQLTAVGLLQLAIDLYEQQCDATALLVVNNLSKNGVDHWVIDALQSHIGALANLDELSLAARLRLRRKLSDLDAEFAAKCRTLLTSRLASDMTRLDAVADAGRILRLLELAKLATPVLENAFRRGGGGNAAHNRARAQSATAGNAGTADPVGPAPAQCRCCRP